MGGTASSFRIGTAVAPAAKVLVGWTLVDIQQAFLRFDKMSQLPMINYDQFEVVFAVADGQAVFKCFDDDKSKQIDVLEVFAAVTLASDATPSERKKFGFQFFDFDGSNAITADELAIMIRSVLSGLAKLTQGEIPPMAECETVASQVMQAADSIVKDNTISYVEFSQWVRNNAEPRALLSCFTRSGVLKNAESPSASSPAAVTSPAARGAGAGAGAGSPRNTLRASKRSPRRGGKSPKSGSAAGADSSNVDATDITRRMLRGHLLRKANDGVAAPVRKKTGVKYPKAEVLTLKKLFDSMDADKSGSVDMAEFGRGLNDRMVSHMRGMFDVLDHNNDGSITFSELLTELYPYASDREIAEMLRWVAPKAKIEKVQSFHMNRAQVAEMRALFDMYDLNRTGSIDMNELFSAMSQAGVFTQEEIEQTFHAADVDRSTLLSFEEFKQFYKDVFAVQGSSKPGSKRTHSYHTS